MPLTNEERSYIQGMQQQIVDLGRRVDQLQAQIAEMERRAIYEAGQRSAQGGSPFSSDYSKMPTGIDPNGGRRYGGGDPQEPRDDGDRWENEGGK